MTADELSTPLGRKRGRKRRFRLPFTATQAIAAMLGLFLLGFLGFAIFGDDPLGGEPVVRVALQAPAGAEQSATAADAAKSHDKSADKAGHGGHDATAAKADDKADDKADGKTAVPAGQQTVTIIDGSSGARQNVLVPGQSSDPVEPAAAPEAAGINPKLLEKSRYGMIPIAAGGLKPFTAYAAATDAERADAAKVPTVAIVVTGLGIGAAKTNEAIVKLPGAVTLAFTPYGSDPAKLVERARAKRHEVLLQIPMEPFDYPDNDPGPQTLLTSVSSDQNLDRLFWDMSRFQGYVGLANFMGSRFVTEDAAMQPIIAEAAKRGLGYLDDGAAPRSVAQTQALGQAMPFAQADLTIDAVPTAQDIDKALAKLESLAKERGNAVGIASALPISIERIGSWSKSLASRGILLVPLTTAMLKPKSS
ncbi:MULTISPECIES: divergent polysaccharide deacetylase family protein [Rhodopseudomonas]|uniref:Polysaccharide deacetylase n=1 Tax=Rhodopseudomonas palustris TaxID=1076 RepID=A0A0D7E410_RHOPL|nr:MULTISPECIES: divergent polysaccharide deacetylase family protein [Rhodopseudomonas]KIZ34322.1 polysaccharide deacetylase [Rhodopseudomonas palustris]MDF3813923.1 divergent polysaccharide deacetylase family protein [Rhodopseudomonas sp. BAL398]WOK16396.1 divergent polysaccharide deacetylase family protein [Rhodopseudomonas sp. BAL398]